MRCLYCHNPDTWSMNNAIKMTSEEILNQYAKKASFYKNGGLTVTGGEPLVQLDFLIDLFKKAKERNIHTCIDTSGICFDESNVEKYDELLKYTDLVMLDIKHIDDLKHKTLTGHSNQQVIEFAKYLDKKNISMYIRHVVVKGYTDDEESLMELGKFIGKLKNVKALDVLPFHNLGKKKYEELGLDYKLKDYENLSKEDAQLAKKHILNGVRITRNTK